MSEAKRRGNKAWRINNPEKSREIDRARRTAIRMEALERYGLVCAECGFDNVLALHIDHIEDNGADDREKLLGNRTYAGWNFYWCLKKLGWPDGYQTLCANCNMIKQQLRLRNMPVRPTGCGHHADNVV